MTEQLEFLDRTAGLVPKSMPPSGMSWAVATTIAFGLAGGSLLAGYKSLLSLALPSDGHRRIESLLQGKEDTMNQHLKPATAECCSVVELRKC